MINRNPWVKIQTTIICTEQSKVNGVVSSAGILYTAQGVRPHSGFFPLRTVFSFPLHISMEPTDAGGPAGSRALGQCLIKTHY